MKKKKRNQHKYQKPECTIYKLALEAFVCNSISSVYPDGLQTTESYWDDGGNIDGGVIEF